jgi:hypothetical protein
MATWPVIYAWTGNGYADASRQYKGYYEQKLASLHEQIAAASAVAEQSQPPAASQTPATHLLPFVAASTFTHCSGGATTNHNPVGAVVPGPAASSTLSALPAIKSDLEVLDCRKAEVAKIDRFLGTSEEAGTSDAVEWANSDDPYEREFGIYVLEDIGTQEAIQYVRRLDPTAALNLAPPEPGVHLHTVTRDVKPLTRSPSN